jgi:hypothetical protein
MSDANVVFLNMGNETAQGVPASFDDMLSIRYTGGDTFNLSPELTDSSEINPLLRKGVPVPTSYTIEGTCEFELSNAPQFHRWIPAALLASGDETTWGGGTHEFDVTNLAVDMVDTAGIFTLEALTGVMPANMAIGQWIRLSGFTNSANNTLVRIDNIDDVADPLVVTISGATTQLVAEAGTLTVGIEGSMIRDGRDASWNYTNPKSTFFFEKGFPPTPESEEFYWLFTGNQISAFSVSFQPNALVTGSVSFTGTKADYQTSPSYATSIVSDSSTVFNAASDRTVIHKGGAFSYVTAFDFSMSDLARARNVVGKMPAVSTGRNEIYPEITVSEYWSSRQAFLDTFDVKTETTVQKSYSVRCSNTNGEGFIFTFPNVTGTASLPSGALNEDLQIEITGKVSYYTHPISGEIYTVQVDRFKPIS